ncbi:hypothetical protein NPIL_619221 [Nephila pilipes]|uniref:Uncharacterized protein n=1 Tax=Nephila pilipes TaxID=299642 RepID=A0A8X6JE31_NEPPI|nr:hypothetical protein NPIL_619221 [Nephila pilipes]
MKGHSNNGFFPRGIVIFQDENSKICRAQIIQKWFRQHGDSLALMNSLPQIFYLKPIKTLWDIMEQQLRGGSFLQWSDHSLGEKTSANQGENNC